MVQFWNYQPSLLTNKCMVYSFFSPRSRIYRSSKMCPVLICVVFPRNFGNALGNCLQNKDYLKFVSRLKATGQVSLIEILTIANLTLLWLCEHIQIAYDTHSEGELLRHPGQLSAMRTSRKRKYNGHCKVPSDQTISCTKTPRTDERTSPFGQETNNRHSSNQFSEEQTLGRDPAKSVPDTTPTVQRSLANGKLLHCFNFRLSRHNDWVKWSSCIQ